MAGACEVTRRFYGGGDGGDNAGVNVGACAHGAGRGLYHYYGDVGKALLACTRGNVLQGWGAGWRNNCGSSVYHSAFDGLSASRLGEVAQDGDADVTAHSSARQTDMHIVQLYTRWREIDRWRYGGWTEMENGVHG